MKLLAFGFITLAIAISGILYFQSGARLRQEQARAAEAEEKASQHAAYAAQQEQQSERLKRELNDAQTETATRANEAEELRTRLALSTNSARPVSSNETSDPSPGAKLFKDPEMKVMIRKQQMENVERMAAKIVNSELINQLGLSFEEAGYLKDLLKKKYGPGADITMELMSGELSDAQMAELGRQFKQQMNEADAQIKAFLGEDAYKSFEWQEKSQEEKSRVKELQKKLTEAGQSLSPEQQEALVRAMFEERQNFKFTVDYSDPRNFDYEHLHEFFGEENFEKYFKDLAQLNVQIGLRAQAFLTPEQRAQFSSLQQDQLEKGKVVVRMTNALFEKRKGK